MQSAFQHKLALRTGSFDSGRSSLHRTCIAEWRWRIVLFRVPANVVMVGGDEQDGLAGRRMHDKQRCPAKKASNSQHLINHEVVLSLRINNVNEAN